MLQKKLSKNKEPLTLSGEKMQQLIEDYWTANKNKRNKAFPHFWKNVNQILRRYNWTLLRTKDAPPLQIGMCEFVVI